MAPGCPEDVENAASRDLYIETTSRCQSAGSFLRGTIEQPSPEQRIGNPGLEKAVMWASGALIGPLPPLRGDLFPKSSISGPYPELPTGIETTTMTALQSRLLPNVVQGIHLIHGQRTDQAAASIRRHFAPIVFLPEIRTYPTRQSSLCRGPVFRGHLSMRHFTLRYARSRMILAISTHPPK